MHVMIGCGEKYGFRVEQISASKFQNLSSIPLEIRGAWKNRGI